MDLDLSSLLFLLPFFIFLAMLLNAKSLFKSNLGSDFPPGPRRLPLIGNLHLFASFQPPHRMLRDLAVKYGPLMRLQLGELTTIVVSSADMAKEVLKTHDITFATRPSLLITETIFYGNMDIAFAPYGEYWRQLRKICTLEMLSTRRVQSFRTLREEEFSNLCRWIASQKGSVIDLTERVESTTCEAFMRASMGKKNDDQETFIAVVKESVVLAAGFCVADVYPSIKLLSRISGIKSKIEKLHKILDRIIENIINDHKAANAETNEREDLVDVLLKFNEDGHELYLTTNNIKALLLDLFSAGVETSSTTIGWAMAEMLKNPGVLHKAQAEVRQVFKNKGFVDESQPDELKYLKAIIKETLRMHPPLPLLLPRESSEPCVINGYKLPAKTRVMVNAWAIGRDPNHWEAPENFIPERFLDNLIDYKGNSFEYIPFGAGRRICPGMTFGLANVELPLAMFLYHFDWVLPDGMKPEDMNMIETFGVTARRKDPLRVIPLVKNRMPVK